MARLKTIGKRGSVLRVPVSEEIAAQDEVIPNLKARIWMSLGDMPGSGALHIDSLKAFWDRATKQAPPGPTIITIAPLFRGEIFDRIGASLEGGVMLLPDRTSYGKLGFLNRVLQEHLTPNMVVDYVMRAILATCPPELTPQPPERWVTRLSANLYMWLPCPETQDENELHDLMCSWLGQVRDLLGTWLLPDIHLAVFQVGVLPTQPSILRDVLTLGQNLFLGVRPEIYQLDDCVALYDYRRSSEDRIRAGVRAGRDWHIARLIADI